MLSLFKLSHLWNVPCFLLFITFTTTPAAFGDKDLESTGAPYSLHHSEIITDIAITATLGLTQALIPPI